MFDPKTLLKQMEQTARLESLKLAAQGREGYAPSDVIAAAKEYTAYILGSDAGA